MDKKYQYPYANSRMATKQVINSIVYFLYQSIRMR